MNAKSPMDFMAARFASAIIYDKTWVHRVVDSLTFEAGEVINSQSVSLDLTVPDLPAWQPIEKILGSGATPKCSEDSWNLAHRREKDQIPVPLALLLKGVIDQLDITLEGKSLPTLTSNENRLLTIIMVKHAVLEIIPDAFSLDEDIDSILSGSVSDFEALDIVQELIKVAESSSVVAHKAHALLNFLNNLMDQFVLFALAPASVVGQRVVMKYKISSSAGPAQQASTFPALLLPFKYQYGAGTWWSEASYHVDITVPTDLVISQVRVSLPEQPAVSEPFSTPNSHRFHGYISSQELKESPLKILTLKLEPSFQGIRKWSLWLSVLFALGFIFAAIVQFQPGGLEAPMLRSSVTLLLVTPALMLSWLARNAEHPFVGRVLAPIRTLLIFQALILYLSALNLATQLTHFWVIGWIICYIAAFLVSAYALYVHGMIFNRGKAL
ncbi:hypothetical protein [Rothia aerolata]|nr:hypothetical protein [Rothia aerolata]